MYSRTMTTAWIATLTILAVGAARAQSIAGDWYGTLKTGTTELHLLVHIAAEEKGAFTGAMDSIDQGVKNLRLSSIEMRDGKLKFTVDAVQGTYEGKVSFE